MSEKKAYDLHIEGSFLVSDEFRKMKPADVKLMLIMGTHRDSETGHCYPGVETQAYKTGMNLKTVKSARERLEKMGLIKTFKEKTVGAKNEYLVDPDHKFFMKTSKSANKSDSKNYQRDRNSTGKNYQWESLDSNFSQGNFPKEELPTNNTHSQQHPTTTNTPKLKKETIVTREYETNSLSLEDFKNVVVEIFKEMSLSQKYLPLTNGKSIYEIIAMRDYTNREYEKKKVRNRTTYFKALLEDGFSLDDNDPIAITMTSNILRETKIAGKSKKSGEIYYINKSKTDALYIEVEDKSKKFEKLSDIELFDWLEEKEIQELKDAA